MLSFYCLLYLICPSGFTYQNILGILAPVNLCFSQFALYGIGKKFSIQIPLQHFGAPGGDIFLTI